MFEKQEELVGGLVAADIVKVREAIRNFSEFFAEVRLKVKALRERMIVDTIEVRSLFFFKRKVTLEQNWLESDRWEWWSLYDFMEHHYPNEITQLEWSAFAKGSGYFKDLESMLNVRNSTDLVLITPQQASKVDYWCNHGKNSSQG